MLEELKSFKLETIFDLYEIQHLIIIERLYLQRIKHQKEEAKRYSEIMNNILKAPYKSIPSYKIHHNKTI